MYMYAMWFGHKFISYDLSPYNIVSINCKHVKMTKHHTTKNSLTETLQGMK